MNLAGEYSGIHYITIATLPEILFAVVWSSQIFSRFEVFKNKKAGCKKK